MSERRKSTFSELPGGTTFRSFAIHGTLQPFVKLDRLYREPVASNAVFMGNRPGSGGLVLFKQTDEVEIEQFPWEV